MIPVPPRRSRDLADQTQATVGVFLPVACWAAFRSSVVTSTRSTPSQLWHTRLKDSGRTIWRAIACRCPQHSHVTIARMTPPPGAGLSGPQDIGACHRAPREPCNPPVRDTVVAGLRSGLLVT